MKTNVAKGLLIETLIVNRKKHEAVFLKALENFKAFALAKFEANVDKIKAGKMPETYFSFSVPTNQTKDYDRAIGLLQLSTEDTIELNEADYTKYVLDQWDWTRQWKTASNAYGKVVEDDDE